MKRKCPLIVDCKDATDYLTLQGIAEHIRLVHPHEARVAIKKALIDAEKACRGVVPLWAIGGSRHLERF